MQPVFRGGCQASFLDRGHEIAKMSQLHSCSMSERYAPSLQSLFQERHERSSVAAIEALEGSIQSPRGWLQRPFANPEQALDTPSLGFCRVGVYLEGLDPCAATQSS